MLRTLTGHDGTIGRIAWSPDGRLLATPSSDGAVRIWNTDSGACLRTIRQNKSVVDVAFDPDGRILATAGTGGTSLWDVDSGKLPDRLASGICHAVAFSPHSGILASANDLGVVTLWELSTGSALCRITGHNSVVASVAFDGEGGMLATGGDVDGTVGLWAIPSGQHLRAFDGHAERAISIAFHPGGGTLASASFDRTIIVWDLTTGGTVSILEGHTDAVWDLSFSGDGRLLASNSADGTVRLWDSESGRCRAALSAFALDDWMRSVAFHPHLPILAAVGSDAFHSSTQGNGVVHLWELDVDRLLAHSAAPSVSYTTAKIVLVGESGVGKTGLGWRLAHGEFVEHASTHGQQFWLLDELGGTGADGTKREAILWDLAGQPDYRLIHALYLDDADLALVLFDPTRDDDPLRGVEYWLRQIGRHRPLILVAARGDRGAPRLTTEEIEAFCAERDIAGYVATSALRGDGLDELVGRMRAAIRWDKRPTTVTTQTFKRIKNCLWELKEAPSPEKAILSLAELRARLEHEYPTTEFTDDELLMAVRHLSNRGYLAQLRTSRGELRILLAP
ncbi:MAG: hypothetical protein JO063_04290, partial [Pseudonocardiales bacterium]|nr:hypothetical protein [Pseudonocardiales bacterium]